MVSVLFFLFLQKRAAGYIHFDGSIDGSIDRLCYGVRNGGMKGVVR